MLRVHTLSLLAILARFTACEQMDLLTELVYPPSCFDHATSTGPVVTQTRPAEYFPQRYHHDICPICHNLPNLYSNGHPGETTTYTTEYSSPGPRGLEPATYTITEVCPTTGLSRPTDYIPSGFLVTEVQCTACPGSAYAQVTVASSQETPTQYEGPGHHSSNDNQEAYSQEQEQHKSENGGGTPFINAESQGYQAYPGGASGAEHSIQNKENPESSSQLEAQMPVVNDKAAPDQSLNQVIQLEKGEPPKKAGEAALTGYDSIPAEQSGESRPKSQSSPQAEEHQSSGTSQNIPKQNNFPHENVVSGGAQLGRAGAGNSTFNNTLNTGPKAFKGVGTKTTMVSWSLVMVVFAFVANSIW